MITVQEHVLKISQKLDLLRRLFMNKPLNPLIESMDPFQVLALKKFLWEKTMEFGIRAKGTAFSKEELMTRLRALRADETSPKTPSAEVLKRQVESMVNLTREVIRTS